MDIKKRLEEELKKVGADKDHIRQGFERRAAERRTWAVPIIEAAQALKGETGDRADITWDIEEMGAGVRLGKLGKRGYRRIQISVVAPAPGQDTATYVMSQADSNGKQLAQTVFEIADQAIEALVKAVGEHVANHPFGADGAVSAGMSKAKSSATKETGTDGRRPLTIVLTVLLGIFALLAGWYVVAVLQAVPDDLADKGARTVGGLWDRLTALLN